ncbi:hypothetical protein Pan44_14500 [Caulifigura coniformis]|uniref:Amino acid transporter n=1 Tax=Caulifigura coniformis TaxID=2527983 RepID=A0A517SBD0_9PLAN|nr:hypothetical protein [Caulifigura coniformis]QDT53433.1 hypothetical protein Pan44_14500 [Caulifigura coniformis]
MTTPVSSDVATLGPAAPKPGKASHSSADGPFVTSTQVHHQSLWLWVLCLTGVDYFSTLGYQPTIAFEHTGALTPLATGLLVLVTLLGALPIYSYVAKKSFDGQGSIAMLERLMSGWGGKMVVLALLGFAATDFVITMTLSAADAAVHLVENPMWEHMPQALHSPVLVTNLLLGALGAVFLKGFREVIGLAVVLVAIYLVLNAIVIGSGLWYLGAHPEHLQDWWTRLTTGDWHINHELPVSGHSWVSIALLCVLFFPKLALGLSGFETGVAVMPLIKGDPTDTPANPVGRIRNARKLLATAAIIMSVLLMGSAFVTSTLIPPTDMHAAVGGVGGKAYERALAYLAHGQSPHVINPLFGELFGTIYDISTVSILWFAGASAMSGLLNLVPRYLPRYGMAPRWAEASVPLVILLTLINWLVTWLFEASVKAQGGAYATGVMVLMTSAAVAVIIDKWNQRSGHWLVRMPWHFVLIAILFLYTTTMIVRHVEVIPHSNPVDYFPRGITIAAFFIGIIITLSIISRTIRSTELRFAGFDFANPESRFLWDSMKHIEFPVLVPHRPGGHGLLEKEATIRWRHRLPPETPIVFIEAELGDASDFLQKPVMEIVEQDGRFILRVKHCASVSHVIAVIALELSKVGNPPEVHFGWSDESPLRTNLDFLLFGQGNVPWMVRELVKDGQPDPDRQPRVVIG